MVGVGVTLGLALGVAPVIDLRETLRIDSGAKIDSNCTKNIRGPTKITAQIDANYGALRTAFLSKIRDLQKAIIRDRDCERRSYNDLGLEPACKNKLRIQEKESNQPASEMQLHRHKRGPSMGNLESAVGWSMALSITAKIQAAQITRSEQRCTTVASD
jgi:hypothetical protein